MKRGGGGRAPPPSSMKAENTIMTEYYGRKWPSQVLCNLSSLWSWSCLLLSTHVAGHLSVGVGGGGSFTV